MRTDRTGRLLEDKVKSLNSLKKIIPALKNKKGKIVFTNGCFDLIHYGHVKYLQDAKKKGGILVVAINSDSSVKRIKGKKRPIVNQKDRLRTVAALESVDYVVPFGEETPLEVIRALKPDVLVKGSDWNKEKIIGSDLVLSRGGSVCRIKLAKGRSSTNLIKKIAKIF